MPTLCGMTTSAFDPASRFRFIQFIPYLQASGWSVTHMPNRPDRQWSSPLPFRPARALHQRAGRLRMKWNRWMETGAVGDFDVVFVNRDLAGGGNFFERRLLAQNPRVVFDFDDAIYIGRNEHAIAWMCSNASWVTPGNEYLAEWVRRHTPHVTVIPTVVDTETYVAGDCGSSDRTVRLGWSGSDQSIAAVLYPRLAMLAELQREFAFRFVIISNTPPKLPVRDLKFTFYPWSADAEGRMGQLMDIGLMPLQDDEFQRGKCGLKLLQYMAAGIPAIASPVGVNSSIVADGKTGFLASSPAQWRTAIAELVSQPRLRTNMGRAGRQRCEQHYSVRRWLPELQRILLQAGHVPARSLMVGRA